MYSFARRLVFLCFTAGLLALPSACQPAGSADIGQDGKVTAVPVRGDTVRIPVKVWLMAFEAAPSLDSTFNDAQVKTLFAQVNTVWANWGIEWVPEVITPMSVDKNAFRGLVPGEDKRDFRNRMAAIAPDNSDHGFWQVAIVRQFPIPASGVYIPEKNIVFYGELNKNGDPLPIVLAHELGHSLGLRHMASEDNLMYGGPAKNPEKTQALSPEQVAQARAVAEAPTMKSLPVATPPAESRPTQPGDGGKSSKAGGMDADQRQAIANRLKRFDKNGDGNIDIDDVPVPGHKAFERIDRNGDGVIDAGEMATFENR